MSDLSYTREDIEKVKASACKTKDRAEEEGAEDFSELDLLIGFCDLLLSDRRAGAVDVFLANEDMVI